MRRHREREPAGDGGKPGEAGELPLCDHSPKDVTRVRFRRPEERGRGRSRPGPAWGAVRVPGRDRAGEIESPAWESVCDSGTVLAPHLQFLHLRNTPQPARRAFSDGEGKSLIRAVECPRQVRITHGFPFPATRI